MKLRYPQAFAKLFKVPLPHERLLPHYLKRLEQAEAYKHLPALAEEWRQFEGFVENAHDEVFRWEKKLVDGLEAAGARDLLLAAAAGAPPPVKRDGRTHPDWIGRTMVSFDLVEANFTALRVAAAASSNARGWLQSSSWEVLCAEAGVPPILARSKVLRQRVMGNILPQQQQRLQARATETVAGLLDGRRVVAHTPDEVVFLTDVSPQLVESEKRAAEALAAAGPWRVRTTYFRLVPLRSGFRRIFLQDGVPKTTDLFGVRGDRFYLELARLLGVPPTAEDLTFEVEGMLARWL